MIRRAEGGGEGGGYTPMQSDCELYILKAVAPVTDVPSSDNIVITQRATCGLRSIYKDTITRKILENQMKTVKDTGKKEVTTSVL